jgi:pilus assembly protein CpaE
LTQSIALVGSGDRQVEQLLRSRGLTVLPWMEQDLASKALQASVPASYVMLDVRDQQRITSSLESFCRQHPTVPVLLLMSSLDPALMLEAMRAGVKECLQYPFTVEELDAALARLAALRETGPGGDVFAFLGAKGGVGTTTAAVNVATDLSLMHAGAVLLVDLHLAYGDAGIYLGAEPRYSIADALENTHRLDGAFLKSLCVKTKAGPELLASPDRNLALPVDAGRVRTLIDAAARYYRFVVLDLCRTDPAVLDGLDSVKRILVIANQELATVRAASRMATTLNQRYGKDRVALAVSRYDPNAGIGQEDIERVVGSKIRHLLPSDYRVALEALNTGRPLALSNQTRLAGSLKVLARELAALPADEEPQKSSRSIFGRLTGRS